MKPRKARLGRFRHKATVIGNYPEDPGPELAKTLPVGPTQLWIAGTLVGGRGLDQALAVLDACEDVEIQSAGWIYDKVAADRFLSHPRVHFHGVLSPPEALAAAAACDAVFAFYAPSSINNRLASPNKLYDAISVGRPVIVNEEVAVSKFVTDREMGYVCKYDDEAALTKIVAALKGPAPEPPRIRRPRPRAFGAGELHLGCHDPAHRRCHCAVGGAPAGGLSAGRAAAGRSGRAPVARACCPEVRRALIGGE